MPSLGDTAANSPEGGGDAGPVYFAFGDSVTIADSTRARLALLARSLKANPLGDFVEITLVGTADPSGSADFNRALGAARARRVRALLTAAGLNANYKVISAGEDPAFLVTAAAGRGVPEARANRRVQFLFGIRAP
jgi:outer membrane protein OmpA-like peptidoglycan-associated protein